MLRRDIVDKMCVIVFENSLEIVMIIFQNSRYKKKLCRWRWESQKMHCWDLKAYSSIIDSSIENLTFTTEVSSNSASDWLEINDSL